MQLCSIGELAVLLGVSVVTLRRWDKAGRLRPACRTVGRHRRYDLLRVKQQFGMAPAVSNKTLAYARVSSHDQKEQLQTQATRLRQYCEGQDWTNLEVVTDLGSGMNCRKKGLIYLLQAILTRDIRRLGLVTKDRLLRFGADLLFQLCKLSGIDVVILDEAEGLPPEQQLVADLISLMTVFTSKLYGARSRENRQALDKSRLSC